MAKKTITLFYGGDTNIGRRMNFRTREVEPFVNMEEMKSADIRLVNLECVIATKGQQGTKNPGNSGPFYLRARPEQTNILVNANIDIVLTANNHAGDYGRQALLEELEYLDAAGILHAGSGKNFSEAFAPVYKRVNDITVAIFSVDSTWNHSAATIDKAGTAYLSRTTPKLWRKFFADKIRAAHEKAHVVIVAAHWGSNYIQKPGKSVQAIARIFIDLGADAVLGCHAHKVHGVETYKDRPIIYDAGDLLFDTPRESGYGCFTLEISADGVEKVKFIPLTIGYGQTSRAVGSQAELSRKNFVKLCNEFQTATTTSAGNVVEISFTPPPRESKILNDFAVETPREKKLIEPLTEPRPEWIVDSVPEEAIITPQRIGPLKLVGYHVAPEYRTITARTMPCVETYWTIDEPVDEDYRLSIKGVPIRECNMETFGAEPAHEFLDYMFPINRWKPGVIYRERYGMHPPAIEKIININLRVTLQVFLNGKVVGKFKDPNLIRLHIPNLSFPYFYDKEFDDIIYKSEPGKCWTAEQLAKVTGGKWIVPPPQGWFTQALFFSSSKNITTPCLALITPKTGKAFFDNPDKFDGVMTSHDIKGLPKNFPVLKVKNIRRAFWEVGIAARRRFQGKVIAVTGSAGKTTTCNMLKHFLSKDHKVQSTPGNENGYDNIPRAFANVKQDDAYAILETSLHAFARLPGSITYEVPSNVAVVTSLMPAHTGSGGSLERLAKYKSKIFCGMSPGSYAIINRDMPYYELFAEKAKSLKLNVITFGTHSDAAIRMPVLANDAEFYVADKTYKISCPVPAEQLYDALAVIGVSIAVGIPVEKTLEHLKTFTPVKGRGNVVKSVRHGKSLTIINSAFNANPVSMKYALEHLKTVEPNQKSRVAILGDIADLDSYSVKLHRQLAEPMLAAQPDRLFLCGKLMRNPYEVVKDKLNVTWFEKLDDLLTHVESHLRDGDTILIKSSHATGLSKVVDLLGKSTAEKNSPSEIVEPLNENSPQTSHPHDDDTILVKSSHATGLSKVVELLGKSTAEKNSPSEIVEPLNETSPQISHLRDDDTILIKSSHATGLSKVVELLGQNTAEENSPSEIVEPLNETSPQISHPHDDDTILVKSSHATGLSKVVELLSKNTAEKNSPSEIVEPLNETPPQILNVPSPLFDVKNFLPEGIAPEMNGNIPADKLKRIHCGGRLYVDAARAWLAMVRAAAQDKIFLNVNNPFNAYRRIESQIRVFSNRFAPVDNQDDLPANVIRVEFEDKIWRLKPNVAYAAIPGTSSHGYGLAVDLGNIGNRLVRIWLNKNAASFGFVKEYSFEPWHFVYVKSREGIPERVLEIESLPPEPIYTAEQIQQISGCQWLTSPPEDWTCNGIFYSRPIKVNHVAIVDQGAGIGISEKIIGKIFRQLAGFICVNPKPLRKYDRPILVTSNLKETIEKISAIVQ